MVGKTIWRTKNEGAFAGIKGLGTLNSIEREKVLNLAMQGRTLFLGSETLQSIRLGWICVQIRRKAGDATFERLVEEFWLEEGQTYSDVERRLQICQQMHHRHHTKGPKIPTDIPKDSYLRLMNYISSKKRKSDRRAAIRSLTKHRTLNGVDIGDSKTLRHAVEHAKKAREEDDVTADELFECRVSRAITDLKRVATTLESAIQKVLDVIPKKPSDREKISSRLMELQNALQQVKPKYEIGIEVVSKAAKQTAPRKPSFDPEWGDSISKAPKGKEQAYPDL